MPRLCVFQPKTGLACAVLVFPVRNTKEAWQAFFEARRNVLTQSVDSLRYKYDLIADLELSAQKGE